MVEYSHADIHLGMGWRCKDCPNILLVHLFSPKERSSLWVTQRLRYGKVMKSLFEQKDVQKCQSQHRLKPLPHFCLKHQSVPPIPIMCPTCCKCLNDQHKVTAITVTLPTARTPDVRPEVKEKFEEICRNRGIQKENILDFTKAGKFTSFWFVLPESLCYWLGKQEKVTPAMGPLSPTVENFIQFLAGK